MTLVVAATGKELNYEILQQDIKKLINIYLYIFLFCSTNVTHTIIDLIITLLTSLKCIITHLYGSEFHCSWNIPIQLWKNIYFFYTYLLCYFSWENNFVNRYLFSRLNRHNILILYVFKLLFDVKKIIFVKLLIGIFNNHVK